MDAKAFAGKTLFFVVMVLFIAGFSAVFGQENSLIGVIVVVMALMLLQRDLSARPGVNLAGILVLNVAMGLCAYVSVTDEYVGLLVNVVMVFVIVVLTMQDLASPAHFPFLLGYAFMLAVPVDADQLPVRLLALAVGSVLVVAMNVVVNRGRFGKVSRAGMTALCGSVAEAARRRAAGGTPDPSMFDASCRGLGAALGDRLRSNFLVTARDRSVLDLMVAVRCLGRRVCECDDDPETLRGIASLMDLLGSGEATTEAFEEAVARLRASGPSADPLTMSAVASVGHAMSRALRPEEDAPRRVPVSVRMREVFRTDSARFTFGVRMTLLFSMWAFVWRHWDLENAKWLLFTTVAIVQPYVDRSVVKSAHRVAGTLVGAVAFVVLAALVGGDVALMSAALLVINYVYTVLDPKRYDVQMAFVTVSALIAAGMAAPTDAVIAERVLYILAGVLVATLANYIILPYRLREETLDLAARRLAIAREHISCLMGSLRGSPDDAAEAGCVARSAAASRKMSMNAERDPSPELDALCDSLDDLSARCADVYRSARTAGPEARAAAISMLEDPGSPAPTGFDGGEEAFLEGVVGLADSYRAGRSRLADLAVADRARGHEIRGRG